MCLTEMPMPFGSLVQCTVEVLFKDPVIDQIEHLIGGLQNVSCYLGLTDEAHWSHTGVVYIRFGISPLHGKCKITHILVVHEMMILLHALWALIKWGVVENVLRQQVYISEVQCGFMPGGGITRNVPCRKQDTVHSFRRSGKGFWWCTQVCHLVRSSRTWRWGVVGASDTEHVWKCQKQSASWLQPEWRGQCKSGR